MIRQQRYGHALGSEIVLTVIVKNEDRAENLFQRLWSHIIAFENRFSRFIETSELTHVNQNAGAPTKISLEFYKLMKAAMEMNELTGGLYSPFILPQLMRAGYKGSWPNTSLYNKKLDYSSREGESRLIELDKETILIPKGSAIDFGGIGKGYLLDELSDLLRRDRVRNYWLSLGGDIICAGHNLENVPWSIGIAKADAEDEEAGHLINEGDGIMAIATSGITRRKGEDWHHIIDPRSGRSAETDVLTATVKDISATNADVYAKCLVILGLEKSQEFMKHVNLHTAILQTTKDNKVHVKRIDV